MKTKYNVFVGIVLLALLVGSCDKSVDPTDPLYQRWQQIELRSADGSVFWPDQNQTTITTFKPSGEYVYKHNGKQYTCCQPNRFVQQGNQLTFSTVAGGYVSPDCIYSLCVSYQPQQVIDSLSAQRLVLSVKGSIGQAVYQAVR